MAVSFKSLAKRYGITFPEAVNCVSPENRKIREKQYNSHYSKADQKRKRDFVRQYKSEIGCSRCEEKHPACLDFHHKDPDKKNFQIMQVGISSRSFEKIKEEITKCDILCANCHRKEHFMLRENDPETYPNGKYVTTS